jgi:hypothetical protein
MDAIPLTGVDELDLHLDQLLQDSSLVLNAKLFDHVHLQLRGNPAATRLPFTICSVD